MTTSIQTDALLARFAVLAYQSESFLRDPDHLPAGWRLAVPLTEGPFGAFAFRNDVTGQVIVSYRGTDGLSDLAADAAILSGNWSTQFQQGIDFMSALRSNGEVFPAGYSPANVLVTGHSLGGAIAQVTSQAFGLDGAAMDPGAAGRIVKNPEFLAAIASAGLPPGGLGMPSTFMNWVVTDSLVSNASGAHLGSTNPVPTLGFSSQQALTAFLIGALNPGLGFAYAVANDQFVNKHASTQISAAMNLLAGIHDASAEAAVLTLNRRVVGYYEGDGSTREPIYSQSEFEVRASDGSLTSRLSFYGSGAERSLEIRNPNGELQSTIVAAEGGAVVRISAVYGGSVELRGLPETVSTNDASVAITRRSEDGALAATAVVQTFDDGSSIATSEQPDGTIRTVTRNVDQVVTHVREEQSVGTITTVREYDPSSGALQGTTVTQRFDDGSRIEEVGYADGSSLRFTYDDANQLVSRTGTAGPLQSFGTAIQDINALVGAIRSGQPLPVLSSGLRLIDNQVNPVIGTTQTVSNQALFQTTAVVSAINSLYSLDRAFSGQGSDLDRISATANAIYSIGTAAQATGLISDTGVLAGVSQEAGRALPYISAAIAIKNGDYVGAAVSIAAISFPVVGWIYAAYSLITALGDEPPEAWATGRIRFVGAGNVGGEHDLYYDAASGHIRSARDRAAAALPTALEADIVGDAFGPQRVSSLLQGNGQAPGSADYFGGLLGYLDGVIAQAERASPNVRLGIVPQRLPSITWQEARRSDPGYSIVDVDPLTGEQRHPQLRYNDDFSPYNADPTDPAQRRDLFQRMIDSALERNAIAPEWEVRTALLQQDAGDPNAGLTEEERGARRGLAAPADANGRRESGHFRPIALDLNGDGAITTVTNAASNVGFDWDDSGFIKQTGWVGTGEGLLMLDRNLSGTVDSGRELFSNGLVADAARGVRSLAWVDANADGRIDTADPVFNELRVWQDVNANGVVDSGEVSALVSMGITQLDYAQSRFTRNGQMYGMSSPDIEADAQGIRASQAQSGIRVEYSDGNVRLFVTRAADLGGGGVGSFTVGDDGISVPEDGSDEPRSTPSEVAVATSLLLANDQFGGSPRGLTVTAVGAAQNGAVRLDAAAGLVYFTPAANFNGPASFAYTVLAPSGDTRDATVQVTVTPVADVAQVAVEIPSRPIYGWDTRQVTRSSGGAQDRQSITTIYPAEGEPRYAPFYTVGGQLLTESQSDSGGYESSGDVVDLGISQEYFQRYFNALAGEQSSGDSPLSYVVVVVGNQRYAVSGSPPTYLHDTIVGSEPANDGRVLATAAEGTGSFRFEIDSNPLYGEVAIDASTGVFAYTGRRPVGQQTLFGSNALSRNAFTDFHNRYDETFTDVFQVRVVDLSDPTGQTFTTRDVPVTHYGPRPLPEVASGGKPIAIDLNGDGFHFTDVDDSNVFLDVNGDGWRRRIAWNNPADGFIAYDRNGDGKITDFEEISFVGDDARAQTDLQGLRAFDTDGNGSFTSADAKWSSFGVWQDAESDGLTDAGEFRSLTDMGIDAISLTSDGQFRVIDNQTVHGIGTATRIDGTSLAIADVTLRFTNEAQVPNPGSGRPTTATAAPYSLGQAITGTGSADLAFGTSGNDQYRMGEGNDVVNDDAGNDNVDLGVGNDLAFTGTDNDFVIAGAGNDSVFTGSGNDIAHGGDGNDVLMMEDGNDIAFGADGNDLLCGGTGNDLLSGDAGNDRLLGQGGWDALLGGAGDDELWGMDGNDQLDGGDGNDLLVGGTGSDVLSGGRGNDTYQIDSADDTVTEAVDEGEDTVLSSVSYALAETVEHLTLIGTRALSGSGNARRNVLVGNEGDNTLFGWGGDDELDGGRGRDTLVGGTGDDSYVIDDIGDVVVEAAAEGNDTIRSRITMTAANHVENLTLTGIDAIDATGNSLNNVLVGNGAANRLDGGSGADRMEGGRGNDTYVVDDSGDRVFESAQQGYDTVEARIDGYVLAGHVEALILGAGVVSGVGNALDNTLTGNAGANRLDGGSGADLLIGGAGDDTYVVDDVSDRVVEAAFEGSDTIVASVDQTLSDHVEALVLTGTAEIWGRGNALDNVLTGNAASNHLDGGSGADSMAGGAGDDTYVVADVGDLVLEQEQQGYDTVEARITDYTLTDHVEALLLGVGALNGTGNGLDNTLIGNASDNRLDGRTGADSMVGGAGDDTYIVEDAGDLVIERADEGHDSVESRTTDYTLTDNVEALRLGVGGINGTGNALGNALTGNAAANRLDGGAGDDLLVGGSGDDIYVVDRTADSVVEAAGEGFDTVQSSATYVLAANVENLVLTGNEAIDGTGNELDNQINGNAGDNKLLGASGNDSLRGDAGSDLLDGGTGADALNGGIGDDKYVVDQIGDDVFEAAGSGFDQVFASIDYALTANVEMLSLIGSAVIGRGNALDNLLFGNAEHNVLDGNFGADRMAGGDGDDRYAIENAEDRVAEAPGGGIDTVYSSVSRTLEAEVENLVLTGNAALDGIGNESSNALVGNFATNGLTGGGGADVLAGGGGSDCLDGGAGDDLYLYFQSDGRDTLTDIGGTDTLRLGAGMTLDSVAGRTITVEGQSRIFISILNTDGTEQQDQGIDLAASSAIERVEFADGRVTSMSDVMIGTRSTSGGSGDDTLTGDRNDDIVHADAGDDVVYGRTGNDVLYGQDGEDHLFGEGGNDQLEGGSGNDQLWGGAGQDTLDGGTGRDLLFAGSGDDVLLGGSGNDLLDGGSGEDRLYGHDGADGLYSGAGNDRLDGGRDDDLLAAGDGNDLLLGGDGRDVLIGGNGNDLLDCGEDSNFIDGGAGDDRIVVGHGENFVAGGRGNDTITLGSNESLISFDRGDGADTVIGTDDDEGTVSLGGGLRYADLALRRAGNSLVLEMDHGDTITFQDWYKDHDNRSIRTLQMVTVGGDYAASSTDRLNNRRVVSFDFKELVKRFDVARAADPTIGSWALARQLDSEFEWSSDDHAIGGDFAYRYATLGAGGSGSYGDMGSEAVRKHLFFFQGDQWARFTLPESAIDPWTAMQAGVSLTIDQTVGLPSPISPVAALSSDQLAIAALCAVPERRPQWLPAATL